MPLPVLLWSLISLALCTGCSRRAKPRPGVPPKHLILVTIEGLRADHCSAYAYARQTTSFPIDGYGHEQGRALTIDDLANSGVLFRHAMSPSSDPDQALASVLIGARPLELAAGQVPPTLGLAERFAEAGFLCAGFVSRPGEGLPAEWRRGFHRYAEKPSDLETLAPAITFASEHDWGSGRGVFLWLHLSSPAPPFVPRSFDQAYFGSEVDYASLFTDPQYQGPARSMLASEAPEGPARLTQADQQFLAGLYDGEVAFSAYLLWYALDLMRYFTETEDSLSQAVFCVAGASGVELDRERIEELGWGGTTDAALGVPLLLRHPESMTGRRILKALASLEDLGPTMIDWFGLAGRGDWRGRSLLGVTDARPRERFEPGPSCSYDPSSDQLTARGLVWRLTVPRSELGRQGEPLPAQAQLTAVESLRHIPDAPGAEVALELLEALRAWGGASPVAVR